MQRTEYLSIIVNRYSIQHPGRATFALLYTRWGRPT